MTEMSKKYNKTCGKRYQTVVFYGDGYSREIEAEGFERVESMPTNGLYDLRELLDFVGGIAEGIHSDIDAGGFEEMARNKLKSLGYI